MKILCIGDSNTFGYDPRSCFGGRYPSDIRWTGRLKGHHVVNCALNGMTVPRDPAVCNALIRSEHPELVTVMLGVNDLLRGESAEVTASRMERFLAAIHETGARILLIAQPPVRLGEWVQREDLIESSKQLAVLYRAAAGGTGTLFADAGEWNVALTFDGVHFSPEGHAAFAEALGRILKEMTDQGRRD